MGFGDFFRRRRDRESMIPASATGDAELGTLAASEGPPVVGEQIGESVELDALGGDGAEANPSGATRPFGTPEELR